MKRTLALAASCILFTWSCAWAEDSFTVCEATQNDPEREVYPGLNGWLFVDYDLATEFNPAPVAPYLERLAQAFADRGITLLAVVIPRRGMVDNEQLDPNHPVFAEYDLEEAVSGYQTAISAFRDAGIIAPDLVAFAAEHGADQPFFLKRDLHWSPQGARLSAQAVAESLKPLSALQTLPKQVFQSESVGTEPQVGSWQKIVEEDCGAELPPEEVEQFVTRVVSEAGSAADQLFGEVEAPQVVLLGDSNSQRPDGQPGFNFDGFLREYLGLDVLNAAVNGGGAFTSLKAYFSSPEYALEPPAIALWEFRNWSLGADYIPEFRQAIPSVYGPCEGERLLSQAQADLEDGELRLDNEAELAQGNEVYLHLKVADPTLNSLAVVLRYTDGSEESLELENSTRAANAGDFFLELSSDISAPLSEAVVSVPKGHQGSIVGNLCLVREP